MFGSNNNDGDDNNKKINRDNNNNNNNEKEVQEPFFLFPQMQSHRKASEGQISASEYSNSLQSHMELILTYLLVACLKPLQHA